jgi:hypothetical protein
VAPQGLDGLGAAGEPRGGWERILAYADNSDSACDASEQAVQGEVAVPCTLLPPSCIAGVNYVNDCFVVISQWRYGGRRYSDGSGEPSDGDCVRGEHG